MHISPDNFNKYTVSIQSFRTTLAFPCTRTITHFAIAIHGTDTFAPTATLHPPRPVKRTRTFEFMGCWVWFAILFRCLLFVVR